MHRSKKSQVIRSPSEADIACGLDEAQNDRL
jgi:hypothetical protein